MQDGEFMGFTLECVITRVLVLAIPQHHPTTEKRTVLSFGWGILTLRITEAFGVPKLSLFCIVQKYVASLPSYRKLKSNSNSYKVRW